MLNVGGCLCAEQLKGSVHEPISQQALMIKFSLELKVGCIIWECETHSFDYFSLAAVSLVGIQEITDVPVPRLQAWNGDSLQYPPIPMIPSAYKSLHNSHKALLVISPLPISDKER